MTKKSYSSFNRDTRSSFDNFQANLPRTIHGAPVTDSKTKTAAPSLNVGDLAALSAMSGGGIYRNPARRFYDPEISTTAIYMPRTLKQKNRWRRWFFDHDEFIGAVLELHAELPHSRAEIMCDDKMIKNHVEECFDDIKLFSKLPILDLEYTKIGEVFIHTPWDDKKGMWSHIIPHNPDFVEVTASPFVDDNYVIELIPDDQLKAIVNSTKPQDQQLKRRLPVDVIRRVNSGRNLLLDPDEVTHLARRSNPYDLRGTSIIDRLFRLLMYEDKLREAQITIADNFIYPLKIFKLGDPNKGWIPNESHQAALAQMLQQSTLDPNFALIYHYGLQVDYVTVADKVMKLDPEWNEINNKKAIALGVSQQFITGDTTYASANVGLQTQLARYKAKRDLFEINWIRGKLLKVMAERNGWYRRDKKELVGQYRVTRSAEELKERLIIPKLVWHKKLMMRDDQSFLTFLNNVYANGKGPVSTITLLQAIGLEIEDELTRKKLMQELEERVGVHIQAPTGGAGNPGLPSLSAKFKNWTKIGKKQVLPSEEDLPEDKTFVGEQEQKSYLSKEAQELSENKYDFDTFNYVNSYNVDDDWHIKLNSSRLPEGLTLLFKRAENIAEIDLNNVKDILSKVYMQGKTYAYNKTNFVPYTNFKVAGLTKDGEFVDYSDYINCDKFSDWYTQSFKEGQINTNSLRSLLISVFAHGQLTGYEEQGIFNIRVTNVPTKDGFSYKSADLLKTGINIALSISPDFDIPLFQPYINNISVDDIDDNVYSLNTIDPQIKPYKTFYCLDTEVENCPIEVLEESEQLFNKINTLLSNEGINKVKFVDDVTNQPEWEEQEILSIKTKTHNSDLEDLTKNVVISSQLNKRRNESKGLFNFTKINNTLYISTRVASIKKSLTSQFFDEYKIFNTINSNLINSKFHYSKDLSKDEIEVGILFKYLTPVTDDSKELLGYKVSANIDQATTINPKLVKNAIWDANGRILETNKVTPINIFKDNINNYVNYSYKVPDEIRICFGKLYG